MNRPANVHTQTGSRLCESVSPLTGGLTEYCYPV
jgi:hypothetical protein